MLWIATLGSQLLFGLQIARWVLPDKYNIRYWIGFSAPLGFGLSSLIYFMCASVLGMTAFHTIIHTCAISGFSYILIGYMYAKKREAKQLKDKERKDFFIFLGISFALAFVIVPKMYLPKPRHSNIAFSTDVREEISLIQSFYCGVNSGFVNIFKIRHTACYRCIIRTGWITGFHSAIMRTGYASLRNAMVWPSVFMFASICYSMLSLSNHFLRSVSLSIFSLVLFLFAGGFGFCRWLEKEPRRNRSLDFMFNYGTGASEWSHPLFHYIFAFRCAQLGLCVVLSVFLILTKMKRESNGREFAVLGLLVGLLPGIDISVCLTLFVYLCVFFIISRIKPVRIPVFFVTFGMVSAVQILQFVPRETYNPQYPEGPFWQPLISQGVFFPALTCWFDALGFLPLFSLILCWFFIDREMLRFYLPSILIFCYANAHMFFPYSRHNIKVFYPLWMTFAVIATLQTMHRLTSKPEAEEVKGVIIGVLSLIYVCSIWSGVLGYYRLRDNSVAEWTEDDERIADWIASQTPKKAVFLDCQEDYSVVATLAGKVVYLQSEKIAWMNGYDVAGRKGEIEKLLESPGSSESIPRVKYGVASTNCNKNIQRKWKRVFSHGNFTVYERP